MFSKTSTVSSEMQGSLSAIEEYDRCGPFHRHNTGLIDVTQSEHPYPIHPDGRNIIPQRL